MKQHFRFIFVIGLLLVLTIPLAAQDDVEANKAIVTRYIEEIFNGGDTALMAELFGDGFKIHDAIWGSSRYPPADAIRYVNTPPLDLMHSDYFLIGQGDLVVEVYVYGGTVQDRPIATPAVDIIRLENGKIAEIWSVYDGWLYNMQPFPDDHDAVPEEWFPVPGSTSATPDDNTALVERALDMWKTGNTDSIAEVYADDLVFHFPLSISAEPLDREGVAGYIGWMHTAMPDFELEFEDQPNVTEGDLVAYYYTWSGKITGDVNGRTRTRTVKAENADLYRIQDGKIAEVWWNWHARNFANFAWFTPPVVP
jgi:ketosteroid isomerase-like protein